MLQDLLCPCVRMVGGERGSEDDVVQGFSPLNLQLRVSLGLPEERKGILTLLV